MMTNPISRRIILVCARVIILILLIIGIILSGRFAQLWDRAGLAFVLLGGIALLLMSFSFSQIGLAARNAAGLPVAEKELPFLSYFWEAAGRNFWILGVLAVIINFVLALCQSAGGLQEIAFRMGASFRPALYGLILGVLCAVPALKLKEEPAGRPPGQEDISLAQGREKKAAAIRFENFVGFFLFIAILCWTAVWPSLRGSVREYQPLGFFFNLSALLVVFGGSGVLILFLGRTSRGAALGASFAVTGLVGSLMGFLQTLFAFSYKNIQDVAAAIAFVISSCFIGLLGMLLVGIPFFDREACFSRRPRGLSLSRLAWYVFPLLTLIFLIVNFILVITPIKR